MTPDTSIGIRLIIGKLLGFSIGIAAIVGLLLYDVELKKTVILGILLWHMLMGSIIGLLGVYSEHPLLRLPFSWWVRSLGIGAYFNLCVTLIFFEAIQQYFIGASVLTENAISPFSLVLVGAVSGLISGFLSTKIVRKFLP